MAVFDAATKIGRRVPDPLTDKKLCPQGCLGWPMINSTTALGMYMGTDVVVVHGDQWRHIDNNVTVNIGGNLQTTIFKNEIRTVMINQTITVISNHTLTVIGVSNITRIGAHITLNVSVYNSTYIAVKNELHCAPNAKTEPTSKYKVACFEGKVIYCLSQANIVIDNKFAGVVLAVSGYKCDIAMLKTDAKALENKACGLKTEATGLKAAAAGLKAAARGIKARVSALAAQVGARLGGPPTSLGAN
jgi:hypothetical protein